MSVQTSALPTADGEVTATTSEAVVYAPWIKRAISFALDELLIQPLVIGGYVVGTVALSGHGNPGLLSVAMQLTATGMAMTFYNRCIRMGMTGQSWGRLATRTKLVSERTGKPIGVGRAIIREGAHLADGLTVGLGYLFPLWDRRKQCFADKIVRTVVVETSRSEPVPLSQLIAGGGN